eukprot:8162304-Alexandrium_andersonii.AAC.1
MAGRYAQDKTRTESRTRAPCATQQQRNKQSASRTTQTDKTHWTLKHSSQQCTTEEPRTAQQQINAHVRPSNVDKRCEEGEAWREL